MIDFRKIYFGCADADTEAERNPDTFKRVFFDPSNYLEELISGDKFILSGRKGDGKTAYGAQINLISAANDIYTYQRSLNNFNNTIFTKIKTYETFGGNPYISFWKCVLMIECVRMVYKYEPHIDVSSFINITDALSSAGFLAKDSDISVTVTKLVEADSVLSLKAIFQHSRKYVRSEDLRGAEQIYSAIKNSIENIYLQKRFILILDGLDDILNNAEYKSEIISGLIRAVEEINRVFRKTTLSIKIIILIRDDILNLCRDPNLSKIRRDSGIRLSWTIQNDPHDSSLIKLVSKRINEVHTSETPFLDMWRELFPEKIGTKNSLDYMLDNIIYRPRDILQFFIEVQRDFTPGKRVSEEKFKAALSRYSEDYFVDAMKDEITGFFPNDAVSRLPTILSKMGSRYFYPAEVEEECRQHPEFQDVSALMMLDRLFVAGYLGQLRPREMKDFPVFSYRNPHEVFHKDHQCILHRGLSRALTIY